MTRLPPSLVPLLVSGLAAVLLTGCDVDQEKVKKAAQQGWDQAVDQWGKISSNPMVQKYKEQAQDVLNKYKDQAQNVSQATLQKSIEELSKKWAEVAPKTDGDYKVPPTCLVAMAVGAGAVPAPAGLGLVYLGFASQGVEEQSLIAMWHGLTSSENPGELYNKMKDIGAEGLSKSQNFTVSGKYAFVSRQFCGVLNMLCSNCVEKPPSPPPSASALAATGQADLTAFPGTAALFGAALAAAGVAVALVMRTSDQNRALRANLLEEENTVI